MAWQFGDGFDCYAALADMPNGYWDSITPSTASIVAGRFAGSRALAVLGNTFALTKSSAVNDAVHHLVFAFQQTSAISGSSNAANIQLFDGATAQCTVVFRSDGAILLQNGGPAGTTVATYTGAFTVINTWYAFEIEVFISNTAGFMNVRKNGNNVNDFTSATNLDTQNSANAYANKLTIGGGSVSVGQTLDDLFWRSDASSVPWMGDIRCYTRMPASDQSVQFSRTSTGALTQTTLAESSIGMNTTTWWFTSLIANYSGTVTNVGVSVNTGSGGNAKCAIYADNAGIPGVVLASATAPVTSVPTGTINFTFSPAVTIVKGTRYWVALASDTGSPGRWTSANATSLGTQATGTYATFPQSNPTSLGAQSYPTVSITYTATPANFQAVMEPQQDATTSYVYDSTVNDADFYGIAAIASTPVATVAVTTRGYMQKSDAGTRTAAVQLKSGSATVASPTLVLTTSGWLWAWRTDTVDPNTSAAWTAAAVNNAQIGPKTIA